ncbi:RAP domain-containing protein [Haematococcus lacustris]|uniref:RAP domain-containing protein n=1 Tax=Haematococcus lacustris TaxID=44745 RepID=A0A699ZD17_HAELA|nr:RAP domain-containing protein [Haematococcus lacustris]
MYVSSTSIAAILCVPPPLPKTTSAPVSQPLPVHQSHETSSLEEVRTGVRAGSTVCGYRPPASVSDPVKLGSENRADRPYAASVPQCADPAMRSLLHSRPGLCIGWGLRPDRFLRSPAPRTCLLPWLPSIPSRTLKASAHTLRQYDPAPRPKQDLEQLVSVVEELPFLSSSSQVEQTSQLLWCFADWARQPENSRARMTQAQCNSVLALLQCMAAMAGAGKARNPPAPPPLQQFDARQLNMAAWSLGKLKPHLPAATVTLACIAIACHSASSEAMKRGGWCEWSNLLHGLATAGMQCSSSPDLTRLCDQAVPLLPGKLARGAVGQDVSMTLWAMAKSGYTGSAQPLLQSVTAAISQGEVMRDAKPQNWANLIWATSKLPGCRDEARQLLSLFAARAQAVVPELNAQNVSNILYAMGMLLWHDKEVCRQLAERAAQTQQTMREQHMANSLYGLARLGYLDSSVRSLAAGVAKADLAAFKPQELTNMLYARSMFLALSNHQAVSSGHSQLASEPQLNSMAAALQWLHACTGGQTSLAASPALQELVAKAAAIKVSNMKKVRNAARQVDCCQLVQALAAAGYGELQQASLSQAGTSCTLLVVGMELRLTRGTAVDQVPHFLHDGSMSGVVAHIKLQQLTHFDAGVVVNKAVFDQLASDSERAAFMREQVRASLPEAEASCNNMLHTTLPHWQGKGQMRTLLCKCDMHSGMQARPRQCHAAIDLVQQMCVLATSTAASMYVPPPLPVTTSAAVSQPLPGGTRCGEQHQLISPEMACVLCCSKRLCMVFH